MNDIKTQRANAHKSFIGYEYKNVNAPRDIASVYMDCYPYFGWEIDDSTYNNHVNRVSLTFKRDRKIKNKPEINKLQRQFEEGLETISNLEASKGTQAIIAAIVIGLIGTAFIAGATFAFLGGYIVACILLAIPGFVGWALPYFLYKNIYKKQSVRVMTEVDREYDNIYVTCEKAQTLL